MPRPLIVLVLGVVGLSAWLLMGLVADRFDDAAPTVAGAARRILPVDRVVADAVAADAQITPQTRTIVVLATPTTVGPVVSGRVVDRADNGSARSGD